MGCDSGNSTFFEGTAPYCTALMYEGNWKSWLAARLTKAIKSQGQEMDQMRLVVSDVMKVWNPSI